MTAIIDSNILIDYLSGLPQARKEMACHESVAISVISWIEVMVGVKGTSAETVTRNFLDRFEIVELIPSIREVAVDLRKAHRIALPDAIIWTTARDRKNILVTRNRKDFDPLKHTDIRIPYML